LVLANAGACPAGAVAGVEKRAHSATDGGCRKGIDEEAGLPLPVMPVTTFAAPGAPGITGDGYTPAAMLVLMYSCLHGCSLLAAVEAQ
jgi:hypothetical protein